MSADAKAWTEPDGSWRGCHDGECSAPESHNVYAYGLAELLQGLETCMGGRPMRWEFRVYPNGLAGLRGFTT